MRARHHGAHREIFGDREGRKDLAAFRHLADAAIADAMARPAGDIGAAKQDASARGTMYAGDRADERAFSRAVRADNRDNGAFADLERHALERLGVAMEDIEAFDREHQAIASAPR